jgi:hypothetical protein
MGILLQAVGDFSLKYVFGKLHVEAGIIPPG